MTTDDLRHLLDEYVALLDGPRNRSLLAETWLRPNLAYLGDVGVPREGKIPIIAAPHLSMWARRMGIGASALYLDPRTYLTVWLKREIGRFREIGDDRPLSRQVIMLIGAGFEVSLLGSRQIYSETEDPWVDPAPVLERPEDVDRLELPDFHKSGLMPLAHRFYEELSELVVGAGLKVVFRDWARSPFAVVMHLRGVEPLLTDMIERPEFVSKLLDVVARSAIHYRNERAKFLGIPSERPELGNDEVNVPSLSPQMYRDLVLPSEKAYASAFGGLTYWHSCGDVTPMLRAIREIPEITIFHVGPWTDLAKAAEVFGDVTLDICIHSVTVYEGNDDATRTKITQIVETCRDHGARSFSIRPGILQAFGDVEKDLAAVGRWCRVAQETVAKLE